MPSRHPKLTKERQDFGERVREIRGRVGLSQEQLAHEAKLDRSYVGQVERGERSITLDNIHRLANALSVSAADLFRESH